MCPHLTAEQTERTNTVWIRKKNLKIENKVKKLLSKRSDELIYTQKEKPSAWKEQDFLVSYKIPVIDSQDVACGN